MEMESEQFIQNNNMIYVNTHKGKFSDENAFKIYKATIQEVEEANFLNSCFPILVSNIQNLKNIAGDKQKTIRMLNQGLLLQNMLTLK